MWAGAVMLVVLVLIGPASAQSPPVVPYPRDYLSGDCLLCHQAAVVGDMAFSMNLLKRFVASGAVQYSFCPQPGRQSCPFQ